MNKSKSCSNFSRRALSESEKSLLNKYNNIENENKNNNIDLKFTNNFEKEGKNFSIKEIEKKLDNNYSDFTYTNNTNKKYNNEISSNKYSNKYSNNNILNEINYKTINVTKDIPCIDCYINKSRLKDNKTKYLEKTINQELINKYMNPEVIIENINNEKNNKMSQTYKNANAFDNFNYINLTESLLNKTQNIIIKNNPNKKIDLKNNSCKNIFNFKRIAKKEYKENHKEIPNLLDTSSLIINNTNKKNIRNLSEFNIKTKTKKKIFENDFKKSNNAIKNSLNTVIIRPYKYISCEKIMYKNNKKKGHNKFKNVKNNINNSQTINDMNKNKIKNIKVYKYKNKNNFIKYGSKENKENKENINENNNKSSLIKYSSILSGLIFKNNNY